MSDDFIIANSLSAEYDIQGVPKPQMVTTSSGNSNHFRGNLGPIRGLPEAKSVPLNPANESNFDENPSNIPTDPLIATQSTGNPEALQRHLDQKTSSNLKVQSTPHNPINPNGPFALNPVNPSVLQGEELSKKVDFDRKQSNGSDSTGITSNYNESEFTADTKSEQKNLEILLTELYNGSNKKDVLSDQMENEPFLSKFFQKYPQSKTDFLAVTLAGFHLALDNLEGAKAKLARIRDPNITDDSYENAGYHRAYYIMQANLNIEENKFVEARKMLKQAFNIPQKFFTDGKESFLDFYSTSMGRVNLKEGKLKEAEECFKDALAQRLLAKNSRLISSSYNELARVYIEKREGEKVLQHLNKARDYDRVFQQELESKKYNVLSGQVDYNIPEIAKTEEVYQQLLESS